MLTNALLETNMKKLALALAAAAAIGLAAPSLATDAFAASGTRAVKVVKTPTPRGVVKKVVVKRTHRGHRGWTHRHHGTSKTVIIKRPNGVVVKKRIIHRG